MVNVIDFACPRAFLMARQAGDTLDTGANARDGEPRRAGGGAGGAPGELLPGVASVGGWPPAPVQPAREVFRGAGAERCPAPGTGLRTDELPVGLFLALLG